MVAFALLMLIVGIVLVGKTHAAQPVDDLKSGKCWGAT
jgi:hypothetical protein